MGKDVRVRNGVQLITYPDSMGGSLKPLADFLEEKLTGIISGVHILPFFPSSGDRGFAPLTYYEVEAEFGTWNDLMRISSRFDLVCDIMVNHISRRSRQFQDYLEKGGASAFADMFLTPEKVWPGGNVPPEDLELIHLRKADDPFTTFLVAGKERKIWTTFLFSEEAEQIDLDVNSPVTREFLDGAVSFLAGKGAKVIRLDAVGYVMKKAGSSCFFVEPEIHDFMSWMEKVTSREGVLSLSELHAPARSQEELSDRGCWTYDFVLPFLVLHGIENRTTDRLAAWLGSRPMHQFTMLDCHDGIPVHPDLEGILPEEEIESVVQAMARRGANFSYSFDRKHAGQREVHQINITWYSAVDRDDDACLAARVIQLFAPGIPQVYYAGLFAGENDTEAPEKSGNGRDINRRSYTMAEMEEELQRPVVRRLLRLMEFRNSFPAFDGTFHVQTDDGGVLELGWENGPYVCTAVVDLHSRKSDVQYRSPEGSGSIAV